MQPTHEHNFTGTQADWEARVLANASHFRLHRYYGQGQCDRCQTASFQEAVALAKAAKRPDVRVLMYAITASGRSTLVTEDKWEI